MNLRARRPALWIALVAILLAALAPGLNAFAGGAAAASWNEVCTASGVVAVPAGDDIPDKGSSAGHCPWCKLHPQIGIPGAPIEFGRLPSLPDCLSGRHETAPHGAASGYHPAQPRAPPPVS